MGFITNEWISSLEGINRRRYDLAHVKLVAGRPTSRFSKDHGLVLRLVAEKEHTREQQVLHFDERDLLGFIGRSLQEIGPEVRAELVSRVLGHLSDEELVAALDGEIAKRCSRMAAE